MLGVFNKECLEPILRNLYLMNEKISRKKGQNLFSNPVWYFTSIYVIL